MRPTRNPLPNPIHEEEFPSWLGGEGKGLAGKNAKDKDGTRRRTKKSIFHEKCGRRKEQGKASRKGSGD